MIIRATARIVPGKKTGRVKRVRTVKEKPPALVKTRWDQDADNRGKGVVTLCISMPPQMFTDLHLFASKMRMNHSHLLRVALSEMMSRNGWKERTDGETP